LNKNEIGDEILFAEINRNFLTVEQILNLTKSAKDLGLLVGISFFHELDIKNFGNEIKIFDFFKIPSAEISNFILINNLINLGKYLLISTGTANENTINSSFSKIKTNKWMPLHCISNYPTASYNSQLGYINYLKNKWNRPVGYSSHDSNWAVICAALMLGVKVVERHITLDKKSSGLDHTSSSTPDEFKLIKDFARNIDKLLTGDNERIPNQGELLNLQNLGRSFYARKDLEVGSLIEMKDFKYLSPKIGYGYELFENSNNPSSKIICEPFGNFDSKLSPLVVQEPKTANPKITLAKTLDDYKITEDRDMSLDVWDKCKKQGFFGMIIPKQYGGKGFSAHAHSQVVQVLSTRSGSVAATVSVPNSLGMI
jgi:sialic acid synthase SpsE